MCDLKDEKNTEGKEGKIGVVKPKCACVRVLTAHSGTTNQEVRALLEGFPLTLSGENIPHGG